MPLTLGPWQLRNMKKKTRQGSNNPSSQVRTFRFLASELTALRREATSAARTDGEVCGMPDLKNPQRLFSFHQKEGATPGVVVLLGKE